MSTASPASTSRIWDLFAQAVPTCRSRRCSAGSAPTALPAYVSGLPQATLQERCDLARRMGRQGLRAIKFAAAVSDDGIVAEMAALREARRPRRRPDGRPALEVHRRRGDPPDPTAGGRTTSTSPRRRAQPEDIEGQAEVARGIGVPLGARRGMAHGLRVPPALRAARHVQSSSPRWAIPASREFLAHRPHGACVPRRHDPACLASASASSWRRACRRRRAAERALSRVPALDLRQEPRVRHDDMGCEAGFYTCRPVRGSASSRSRGCGTTW